MTTKIKILIVEDDAAIRQLYEFKLGLHDFDVRSAEDGEVGLHMAEAMHPDLILLDLRMPIMNGDVMLERVRATDWGAAIRVIILTNISKDEAPKNLRFLGVDRYIVKAHHTPRQVLEISCEVLGLPYSSH